MREYGQRADAPPRASEVTPRSIAPTLSPATAPAIELDGAAGDAPPGAAALKIRPSKVELGSGFPELASEEQRILAPLAGRGIPVSELYAAAAALEASYARAGFILARVVVPPQSLRDGKPARLVLADGFVEHMDLSNVPA